MKTNLMTGVRKYLDRLRSFEVNARRFLYSEAAYRFGRTVFRTLFNLYLLAMGYSMAFIGIFNSMRILARCVGSIPSGILGNKVGLRNALIAGDVAITLAAAVQIMRGGPTVLLLAAGLEGFGVAFRMVNRPAFMTQRSTQQQRNYLFSIRSVINNIVGTVGSGLGGFIPVLIAVQLGLPVGSSSAYRWTLLLSLFVMSAGAAILLLIEKRKDRAAEAAEEPPLGKIRESLQEKALQPILLSTSLLWFGAGLYLPILNAYLSDYLGASSSQVGIIFSARRLLGALAVLFVPLLARRIGRVRAICSVQAGVVPIVSALGLTGSLTVAGILIPVRRSLFSMAVPLRRALTMQLFTEENRLPAYSVVRTFTSLFRGLATTAGAFLMETLHPSSPFLLAGIAYTLSAIVLWRAFSDENIEMYAGKHSEESEPCDPAADRGKQPCNCT